MKAPSAQAGSRSLRGLLRHGLLFFLALAACKPGPPPVPEAELTSFSATRPLMGTEFRIQLYARDEGAAHAAMSEAFDLAKEINQVASDYLPDSEITRLNQAPARQAIPLSPLMSELLGEALDLAEKTGGAYDPSLGPLTRLWRQSRRSQRLPSHAQIKQARASVGFHHLKLNRQQHQLTKLRERMRLDLGGIAKGFAADQMMALLDQRGFPRACIIAGGDIRAGAPPPGESGWQIQAFHGPRRRLTLPPLAHQAASTSGSLHQVLEVDGVRYSHLIDPATGLGSTRERSITVLAPRATLSDPLATALCVVPDDEVAALAAKFDIQHLESSCPPQEAGE